MNAPTETAAAQKTHSTSGGDSADPSTLLDKRVVSAWTFQQKVARVIWSAVQATLFRLSPHAAYRWRAMLLQLFGARLGAGVRVRRSVRVEIPWNLSLGEGAIVGDFAILYCLGNIDIGTHAMVSQYAHLCAGSHDYRRPDMPLTRPPISIGRDCWIAADAFVGPGVTIGDRTIVCARASVFADLPANIIAAGNPARVLRQREPDITSDEAALQV